MDSLESWGWSPFWATAFEKVRDGSLEPARVVEENKDAYQVVTAAGTLRAQISGRLRHEARSREEWPAVGDWVAVTARPAEGVATVRRLLPRRTVFRRSDGRRAEAQVLAANVELALLVTSLNEDFNARRIERFLAVAWESGARPLLVLTKADLCEDVPARVAEAESIAPGVGVHALCARDGAGLEPLAAALERGSTAALVGTSGVGKSTLVNRLLGEEVQRVREIRADAYRGRHTTTARHLLRLPGGALLIDTPGVREVGLWAAEEGVRTTFDDVEELVGRCRFHDCSHESEPGCAVRDAIAAGELDEERFASYRKLQRENAYEERRHDRRAQAETTAKWKQITKANKARRKRGEAKW